MVVIFFLFSSRKSFVLCSDEKKNSLCLWRYQYRISLWLGPAREFRMASKWFSHLSMPKNNSAKDQFVRSVIWLFCIVLPWPWSCVETWSQELATMVEKNACYFWVSISALSVYRYRRNSHVECLLTDCLGTWQVILMKMSSKSCKNGSNGQI